jgi:hypothetical protein
LLGTRRSELRELAGEPLQALDPASLGRLFHLVIPGASEPDGEGSEKNGDE